MNHGIVNEQILLVLALPTGTPGEVVLVQIYISAPSLLSYSPSA